MPIENNRNSAYALQAQLVEKLVSSGEVIASVVWFEVEKPSMNETRVYDPSLCQTDRLKLQITCQSGGMVSVSFDLDQNACMVDESSLFTGHERTF